MRLNYAICPGEGSRVSPPLKNVEPFVIYGPYIFITRLLAHCAMLFCALYLFYPSMGRTPKIQSSFMPVCICQNQSPHPLNILLYTFPFLLSSLPHSLNLQPTPSTLPGRGAILRADLLIRPFLSRSLSFMFSVFVVLGA